MSFGEITIRVLAAVLIYPGLFFIVIAGLLAEGLRRKWAARVEGRGGPPLLQPFYDLRKYFRRIMVAPGLVPPDDPQLTTKNNLGRAAVFFLPLLGILALILAVVLIPAPGNLWPFFSLRLDGQRPLGLDLLGVVLLLQIPALLTLVLGTVASSIYAQIAAARVGQLWVAYLTPYLAAVLGPAIVLGTLDFKAIAANTDPLMLAVKFGCGFIFIVCQPAQLRTRPLLTSSGEALEGVTTNLGGAPLGLFKLMNWAERIVAAMLFAALFVPLSATNPAVWLGALLFDLGVVAVLETLLSQIRLKDALDFYLRYASAGAVIWLLVVTLLVRV